MLIQVSFVGRSDDFTVLSSLAGLLSRGSRERTITLVCGLAGVGKNWFVMHWAHRNLAAFPDGQLYADIRARLTDVEDEQGGWVRHPPGRQPSRW